MMDMIALGVIIAGLGIYLVYALSLIHILAKECGMEYYCEGKVAFFSVLFF